MPLPLSYYSITIADNTLDQKTRKPEMTSTEFAISTLTPANAAATETLAGNLAAALAAVTLGNFVKNQIVYARNQSGAVVPATDPLAQRENKWLLRYHDAVNFQNYVVSVGTADLSLKMANSEFVDLTTGAGAAVKTAFEAVVVAPNDSSHATVLDSMQFVGRNT